MPSEIFGPNQRPKALHRDQLISLLQGLISTIEQDDSMEGSITYAWSDRSPIYDVHAFFRTGNRDGQGGAIVIADNGGE